MSAERRNWEMWALQDAFSEHDCEFHDASPHRRSAEADLQSHQAVVRVRVRDNPDGRYFGWLASGDEFPTMISGFGAAFRMCFPYGPQIEVDCGYGEVDRKSTRLNS